MCISLGVNCLKYLIAVYWLISETYNAADAAKLLPHAIKIPFLERVFSEFVLHLRYMTVR